MQLLFKIAVTIAVILVAVAVSKRVPSLAGLIGVMPLGGALVLVWVHDAHHGDPLVMQSYSKGALWGILPSILFYVVALLCFQRQWPLPAALGASFGAWLVGALMHQWLLR